MARLIARHCIRDDAGKLRLVNELAEQHSCDVTRQWFELLDGSPVERKWDGGFEIIETGMRARLIRTSVCGLDSENG